MFGRTISQENHLMRVEWVTLMPVVAHDKHQKHIVTCNLQIYLPSFIVCLCFCWLIFMPFTIPLSCVTLKHAFRSLSLLYQKTDWQVLPSCWQVTINMKNLLIQYRVPAWRLIAWTTGNTFLHTFLTDLFHDAWGWPSPRPAAHRLCQPRAATSCLIQPRCKPRALFHKIFRHVLALRSSFDWSALCLQTGTNYLKNNVCWNLCYLYMIIVFMGSISMEALLKELCDWNSNYPMMTVYFDGGGSKM